MHSEGTRVYHLAYRGFPSDRDAEMTVKATYDSPSSEKEFKIVSEEQASRTQSRMKLIAPWLSSDTSSGQKEDPPPARKIQDPPPVSSDFKFACSWPLPPAPVPFRWRTFSSRYADKKNNLTCFYVFSAEGVGMGPIKGLNSSATMKGPWNDFKTNSDMWVSQFGGAAQLHHQRRRPMDMELPQDDGTAPRTLARFPPCYRSPPASHRLGAATSIGKMILNPREEMIYNRRLTPTDCD